MPPHAWCIISSHLWVQTGVTVRKPQSWGKICLDLPDVDLWPMTLSFCTDIINFANGSNSWQFLDDKKYRQTDGRTDGQSYSNCLVAAKNDIEVDTRRLPSMEFIAMNKRKFKCISILQKWLWSTMAAVFHTRVAITHKYTNSISLKPDDLRYQGIYCGMPLQIMRYCGPTVFNLKGDHTF